ncbi:MAG: nicotinamide riboside transporter PnuC [Opitutales bacterium]
MLDPFIEQIAATDWVEWLGMATGIVGVWLSIKEKLAAWLLFIVCYSSYAYIGYSFKLHAFMGMNVVFIGISIYGWMRWSSKKSGEEHELPLARTNPKHWPYVGLFLTFGTLGVGWLLSSLDHAQWPYLDALATSCAFTAQWMLSRKQIETWLFWIVTDIIYLGIFASGQSWPSVILFAVFIILAIKGWNKWRTSVNVVT